MEEETLFEIQLKNAISLYLPEENDVEYLTKEILSQISEESIKAYYSPFDFDSIFNLVFDYGTKF